MISDWGLRYAGTIPQLLERSSSGVFRLDTPTSRVGRSSSATVCLFHPTVSRRHAELSISVGQLVVHDRGSRNGTFVDGRKVVTAVLNLGSEVRFGDVNLVVARLLPDEDQESTRRTELKTRFAAEELESHASLLTAAQQRILQWLARGMSEKEIARSLNLSPRTVHNHIQAIYERFGIRTRARLMARLLELTKDERAQE